MLVVNLPVPQSNFTADLQSMFERALVLTAGVNADQVAIVSINDASSARRIAQVSNPQAVQVNSQITAVNSMTAAAISNKLDSSSLNSNLQLQGLPKSTLISVAVKSSVPTYSESSVLMPAVIGGCIGCFVFVLGLSISGYYCVCRKPLADKRMKHMSQNAQSWNGICSPCRVQDSSLQSVDHTNS